MSRPRISLRVFITCMFSLLILLLGAVLIYTQHRHNSAYILADSERRLDSLEDKLSLRLSHRLHNISTSLTLMNNSQVTLDSLLESPNYWWPLLLPLLDASPHVVSLYAGEPDGRSFYFRVMHTESTRALFYAPKEADLVLDIMSPTEPTQRFYFNRDYQLVSSIIIDNEYLDARQRPWFDAALSHSGVYITPPYKFYSTLHQGITLSLGDAQQQRVWAADVLIADLSELIQEELPNARTVLLQAPSNNILASAVPQRANSSKQPDFNGLAGFEELLSHPEQRKWQVELAGGSWLGQQTPLELNLDNNNTLDLRLATLVPYQALMANALSFRREQAWLTLLIIALSLPLVMMVSGAVTRPMRHMVADMQAIQAFNFDRFQTRRYFYKELDAQANAIGLMNTTLSDFINELHSLSQNKDFDHLIARVGKGIKRLSKGQRCLIYRVEVNEQHLQLRLLDKQRQHVISLATSLSDKEVSTLLLNALSGKGLHFEAPWLLHDRFGKLNGIILLGMRYGALPLTTEKRRFISHYSDFANLALEDMFLFEQQRQMTQSMIQVLASAIDAKSPHTSGHCQRVPELTLMLAQAAHDTQQGQYADFHLSPPEWEALHLAAWLHDCGKVVTPEHVINKATKLETIYNRLHEVRMRFEVLKRDADISYWQGLARGEDEVLLKEQLIQQHQQLDDDFAFVAQLNIGDQAVTPAMVSRLQQISQHAWLRTLDDQLGLSWEELQLRGKATALPVWEPLLADKPWHQQPYPNEERINADNRWGINMVQPHLKQQLGELTNLSIERGTLTAEERYIINAHVVHTLIMLSELQYPAHLSHVPQLAASHHERMDGQGYPFGVKAGELPLESRIMALADIFEALTAADRPYKKAKTISHALNIMANMVKQQHLDADLFRFFVEQEVYLDYAERFLPPAQVDEVNKEALFSKL